MTDDYLAFQRHTYLKGLDGLRCVAIIAVIWHHSASSEALPLLRRGFLGVDLFFVLSGFLITTLLIREKARTGTLSLRNFWMRRILRLFPIYYGVIAGMLAVLLVLKPSAPTTVALVRGLPIYGLYLSNWFDGGVALLDPMWSLATEEQFYLFWPTLELLCGPIVLGGLWTIFFIVNQLLNFGVLDPGITALVGVTPSAYPNILQTTFTPILLGVALAHLLHSPRGQAGIRKIVAFPHAPIAYAVVLLLLLSWPAQDISGSLRLSLHVAMTALLASVVLNPANGVTRALEHPALAYIGRISYGMYIYHMLGLHVARVVVERLHLPKLGVFVLCLAITILGAALSYRFVERRFLDLRRRFRP